jgi:dTDP-4-amino-4,6-dideoxygalactose transaminase
MINVTKTYLPDVEKYKEYIDNIFQSGWITNNGEMVKKLEQRLKEHLGVKNILLVSNGTLALQVAYKLLELKGEVITTPFSFVATTSSLVWEGLKPVFVDIDKDTFCLDYNKIEEKVTKNTSAIVPVHVFGNGCEVERIDEIANKHNLKVIYDAAHAFDTKYKGESILNYGDVSILSFHATKIFHTIEGGALIINDDTLFEKAKRLINFGILGPEIIDGVGINAKMNEFQAAMGLCVLDDMEDNNCLRQKIFETYQEVFSKDARFQMQSFNKYCTKNYAYFPLVFQNEQTLINVKANLEANDIFPRRYFYPSLETLDYVERCEVNNSHNLANCILCLPIYSDLQITEQKKIIKIVLDTI